MGSIRADFLIRDRHNWTWVGGGGAGEVGGTGTDDGPDWNVSSGRRGDDGCFVRWKRRPFSSEF